MSETKVSTKKKSMNPVYAEEKSVVPIDKRELSVNKLSEANEVEKNKISKNGSQILINTLIENDVEVCWGIPGGALIPFFDELEKTKLKHILTRHEQGGAHMAEGYAKATGKLGVCIGTSGPGATNLITGIADAKLDSVPLLAITGQVPTASIGTDAFQEVDMYGMSIPITKYNALLTDKDDVARVTQEAITMAISRRPGPSLIDFPKDIQVAESSNTKAKELKLASYHYTNPPIRGDIEHFIQTINRSTKPLLYIGGGAVSSNSSKYIIELAEKANIPVVTTLIGLGVFPSAHDLSLGMIGMHGTAYGNIAVTECDLIIGLGTRFDDRVAGDVHDFASQALRAHIDIDPSEIGKRVGIDAYLQGDLSEVLEEILPEIEVKSRTEWVNRIKEMKVENPLMFKETKDTIKPQRVIYDLYRKTKGEAILVTDVGQHQMHSALYYPVNEPRGFISSGGLGTMGFGYPAALGAKIGRPDKEVVLITGDGSFQMCLQEMATARAYDIKVKIILFNNNFLGMVRQWQEMFFDERFAATQFHFNPDFIKVADGYSIPGKRISKLNEVSSGLDFLLNTDDSCILEVDIPEDENVFPMIPSGQRYDQMMVYPKDEKEGELVEIIPNQPFK